MARDNHIMLVGHNYDNHRLDFSIYAKERCRQLIASTRRGRDVLVQLMDVGAGTTTLTSVVWKDGLSKTSTLSRQNHDPVTKSSYDRDGSFKANQPRVMSITDLYDEVRRIGEAEPSSLCEVSIFSHAYYQGPILVNSNDRLSITGSPGGLGLRDPNDKDARAGKDFSVMSEAQLSKFSRAFSPTGLVWVRGCNTSPDLHRLLSFLHKRYPSYGFGEAIEMKGISSDLVEIIAAMNDYLLVDLNELKRKHQCRFEAEKLKNAIAAMIKGTYSYKLSSIAKVRSISALPGTYTEKRSLADPRQLLEVAKLTRKHLTYYAKNFGTRFDDEDRGYAVFEPNYRI